MPLRGEIAFSQENKDKRIMLKLARLKALNSRIYFMSKSIEEAIFEKCNVLTELKAMGIGTFDDLKYWIQTGETIETVMKATDYQKAMAYIVKRSSRSPKRRR